MLYDHGYVSKVTAVTIYRLSRMAEIDWIDKDGKPGYVRGSLVRFPYLRYLVDYAKRDSVPITYRWRSHKSE
jgi:hypothetical protein